MIRARIQHYTVAAGNPVYFFCVAFTFRYIHSSFKGSFKVSVPPKNVAKLNYKCLIFNSAKTKNTFWHLPLRRRFIIQASTFIL